ncbi:MAG: radical SAM protein [Clostridiales bacterium]|jgi:ribosomal protein S12 methylthiotransferase|nr:radical SAM protein [Clostridiales bacterium]
MDKKKLLNLSSFNCKGTSGKVDQVNDILQQYYDVSTMDDIENALETKNFDAVFFSHCIGLGSSLKLALRILQGSLEYKREDSPMYVVGCAAKSPIIREKVGERKDVKWFTDYESFLLEIKADNTIKNDILHREKGGVSHLHHLTSGCLRKCAFCKSNYMDTSKLDSIPLEDLERELAQVTDPRLVIEGMNTTEYGLDLYGKQSLHKVLQIASKNPNIKSISLSEVQMAEMYPELLNEICTNEKIKSLEFSLESASDRILKLMNRGYNKAHLESILTKIRNARGDSIHFDCVNIAGFPTETMFDVAETVKFIKKYNIYLSHVSPYHKAYGLVPSDSLPKLTEKEIKEHTKVFEKLQAEQHNKMKVFLHGTIIDKIDDNQIDVAYDNYVVLRFTGSFEDDKVGDEISFEPWREESRKASIGHRLRDVKFNKPKRKSGQTRLRTNAKLTK